MSHYHIMRFNPIFSDPVIDEYLVRSFSPSLCNHNFSLLLRLIHVLHHRGIWKCISTLLMSFHTEDRGICCDSLLAECLREREKCFLIHSLSPPLMRITNVRETTPHALYSASRVHAIHSLCVTLSLLPHIERKMCNICLSEHFPDLLVKL